MSQSSKVLTFWAPEGERLELLDYLKTILRNSVGIGQVWRLRRGNPRPRKATIGSVLNVRNVLSILPILIICLAGVSVASVAFTLAPSAAYVFLVLTLLSLSSLFRYWFQKNAKSIRHPRALPSS